MSNPTIADQPTSIDTGADRSQATKRRYQLYTDQHGRKWGAPVEKSTGEPCGLMEKQGWTAPLLPPDKYIAIDAINNTLDIDYQAWIKDTDEAHAYWHTILREHAGRIYGQGGIGPAIENPQPELLDMVGPKPHDSREPIEAMMLGNKWILGQTDAKPAWAEEFFPTLTPESEAEAYAMGKYPDADEEDDVEYPLWSGPKSGWKLSDGECVERFTDEDKESYKTRALDAEASLHGV